MDGCVEIRPAARGGAACATAGAAKEVVGVGVKKGGRGVYSSLMAIHDVFIAEA